MSTELSLALNRQYCKNITFMNKNVVRQQHFSWMKCVILSCLY